jgi:hypothetical protein
MKKIATGALAALLGAAVLAAPALAGPTVTVRVEGVGATLLERTQVTLPDTPPPVAGCDKWTVAAAIEEATNGNWDREQFTTTILGETHAYPNPDYWAEWIDRGSGYRAGSGVCNDVMAAGDEALMLVDVAADPYAPTRFPLDIEGLPAGLTAGAPVTVTVVAYVSADLAIGSGTRTPVSGAIVAGGGATATTGADGRAVLTFPQAGAFTVKASKPGSVISAAERVTVSAPTPSGGPAPSTPPACSTSGSDGRCGTRDSEAPRASFAGLADGAVFRRRSAPRTFAGSVTPDPSGLLSVRLSILRRHGGHCSAFDGGATERFRPHRCGGRRSFAIGDREHWSYLMPKRLGKGRYVIRAVAIDRKGNDAVTRVRIRVR